MRRLFVLVFVWSLLLGGAAAAADFEVRILSSPPEVLMRAPIPVVVDARNVSGHPITVANGAFYFRVYSRTDPAGRWDTCPPQGVFQAVASGGYGIEQLPTGWRKTVMTDQSCVGAPADLEVQAVVSSDSATGHYRGLPLEPPTEFQAWTGEVKSDVVHIRVVAPTGVDFEAYEYFKGRPFQTRRLSELLEKFPTSTYTAYAVREHSHAGELEWDDLQYAFGYTVGCPQLSVPCIHGHCERSNGLENIYGSDMAAWREKWCDIVLKAHPDAWFADEFRFLRACNQLARNNPAEAAVELDALAKNARSGIAERAGQFLTLVKQKGLVK